MGKPRFRDLSDRLSWARSVAGLSAYALSLRAKLNKTHVGLIETRLRKNIDIKTAQAIASVLGISWTWLLTGEGDTPTVSQIRAAIEGAA